MMAKLTGEYIDFTLCYCNVAPLHACFLPLRARCSINCFLCFMVFVFKSQFNAAKVTNNLSSRSLRRCFVKKPYPPQSPIFRHVLPKKHSSPLKSNETRVFEFFFMSYYRSRTQFNVPNLANPRLDLALVRLFLFILCVCVSARSLPSFCFLLWPRRSDQIGSVSGRIGSESDPIRSD